MFKRRVIMLLVLILLVFAGLVVRLYVLQIVNGQKCRDDFGARQISRTVLPAMRGSIVDRNGVYLARNIPCFELCMDYRLMSANADWSARQKRFIARGLAKGRKVTVEDRQQAERMFQEMVDRAFQVAAEACGSQQRLEELTGTIRQRVQDLIASRRDKPIEAESHHELVGELDDAAAARIRADLEGTIGLSVRPAVKRVYPAGPYACHIIGTMASVTAEDRKRLNDPQADDISTLRSDYGLNDRLGSFGIERLCESQLRGRRGYRIAGSGSATQPVVVEAQHGQDVQLTLDIALQEELTRKFREMYPGKNGSIVMLNVADGSVLAMVSVPVYDLNEYRREYSKLVKDDFDFPLINRAIGRAYEPGSTVKPLAALAAMSLGIINQHSVCVCEGRLFPDKPNYLTCTSTHGPLDLADAIRRSCNIYFYRAGERCERHSPGKLVDMYRQFGLGLPTGVRLAGESRGKLRLSTAADARYVAIGQTITATPLQIAAAMATIARRGVYLQPNIIRNPSVQDQHRVDVASDHFDAIHQGMLGVTSREGGTALSAFREAALGFDVCGKSGTAQTPPQWQDKNGNGKLDADEVLRDGNMAWFTGFAPRNNPQVAFAVIVEYVNWDEEGGGSRVAAPLAVEALKACQARGYIK